MSIAISLRVTFQTFENLVAAGSLVAFLASFTITGAKDAVTQFQARMRFMAFTAQFVQRECDPLAPAGISILSPYSSGANSVVQPGDGVITRNETPASAEIVN